MTIVAIQMRTQNGIRGCAEGAPAPEIYRFNSRWDGIVRGQRVTVFAGSLASDPKRGVLLVKSMPADGARRGRHFEGPPGAGTLRLVGWNGDTLKIIAENGQLVWFEVPSRLAA